MVLWLKKSEKKNAVLFAELLPGLGGNKAGS
jgi:hypothetical protein